MKLRFGFGTGFQEVEVPDKNLIAELHANDVPVELTGEAEVRRALIAPIGSPRLKDIVHPGEKIAIITSDITRPMPTFKVMPALLDELYAGGVRKEDVTLVFALGSHRKHTEAEQKKLAGERAWNEIKCVDSDPDDCVHYGTTSRGTPVDITRVVAEADRRICLGNIEYHYFAGYSGGAKAIMETLKARGIHLDSIIDEGGAMLPVNLKGVIRQKCLCGVGVAEKGYADIEISISAKGGHSSQPPKHSAVVALADVIKDLDRHQFKAEIGPHLMDMIQNVGRNATYPVRLLACNLPALKPLMKAAMKQIPLAASMMRTTTGITMVSGSPAANVLPQKASVTVNFRMMPGVSTEDVIRHIRTCVRNKEIEINCLKKKEASAVSPTDAKAYRIIEELCQQESGDNIVAPMLVIAGTDACTYEPVCENIYRFSPFRMDAGLLLCAHATNERLPVASFGPAVAFFKRYIRKASAE